MVKTAPKASVLESLGIEPFTAEEARTLNLAVNEREITVSDEEAQLIMEAYRSAQEQPAVDALKFMKSLAKELGTGNFPTAR